MDNFDICMPTTSPSLEMTLEDPDIVNVNFKDTKQDLGWKQAMQDKMNSIWKNNTWDLTPLPPGRKAITCKWIFKLTPNINGAPPIKKV